MLSVKFLPAVLTCLIKLFFRSIILQFPPATPVALHGRERIITVHGRTKEQKGRAVSECDWEAIRRVKEALPVPVFANGGIASLADYDRSDTNFTDYRFGSGCPSKFV